MSGDVRKCKEMLGNAGKYEEMQRDAIKCKEIQIHTGRYREMLGNAQGNVRTRREI